MPVTDIEITQLMLRLVGVFYLVAGLLGLRAMSTDRLLDQMLAGISQQPTAPREAIRRRFLVSGSFTVGLSGAALMVVSLWAAPLFVIATAIQLGWLLWARTNYVPEDDNERRGRRQTSNATIIYIIMAAAVLWLGTQGTLAPLLDPWALCIPVAGLALAFVALRNRFAPQQVEPDDSDAPLPLAPLYRLHIEPRWGGYPLIDADTGEGVVYDDYLDPPLADRIFQWIGVFHSGDDYAVEEFWAQFDSPEHEAAHRAEGASIASALTALFGPGNVTGPIYPADIRHGPLPDMHSDHGNFPATQQ